MKKLLIINTVGFGFEGISSVIINYLEHISRNELEFDFVVQPNVRKDIKKRLKCLGNICIIPARKEKPLEYMMGVWKLLRTRKYDIIHIHGNSGTMVMEVIMAKLSGTDKRIVHCHNVTSNYPMLNRVLSPIMKMLATDLIACSYDAGKYLYRESRFTVLNNAIDIKKFRFNPKARGDYRKELGINGEVLIGHVGHFNDQKNQEFLIDIFEEYHKMNPQSRLLFVGTGEKEEWIRNKARKKGLDNLIFFSEVREDVEKLYSAMDVFIFPSKWEGLGIALIEAQAAGLPCLSSDVVPLETKCSDLVEYISLKSCPKVWANAILDVVRINRDEASKKAEKQIRVCGYDINMEADKLGKIYVR